MIRRHADDHDHTKDEKIPEAPPIADAPAEAPDPSINPPPEPAVAIPEDARHLLIILGALISALAALADQVPGAHTFATRLAGARASLEALTAMAQTPK